MKITLVPSALSSGISERAFFLSSYLIDETVAIDAGGIGFLSDISVQSRVEHIFLTHGHMDHIASLPIFLETVFDSGNRCVTLHASQTTLDSLRQDVFNNRVWPDFIDLSQKGTPFVKIELLEPGVPVDVGGYRIRPIPVDHVVPTLGFLVEGPGVTVAIPSDTGPTELFWQQANASANLGAVFLEASFPNAMESLATLSKHLTPTMWAAESRKLARPVPLIAVHIKPRFYDRVVEELNALEIAGASIGRPGKSYDF